MLLALACIIVVAVGVFGMVGPPSKKIANIQELKCFCCPG